MFNSLHAFVYFSRVTAVNVVFYQLTINDPFLLSYEKKLTNFIYLHM